jgi:hypothetical protein
MASNFAEPQYKVSPLKLPPKAKICPFHFLSLITALNVVVKVYNLNTLCTYTPTYLAPSLPLLVLEIGENL